MESTTSFTEHILKVLTLDPNDFNNQRPMSKLLFLTIRFLEKKSCNLFSAIEIRKRSSQHLIFYNSINQLLIPVITRPLRTMYGI